MNKFEISNELTKFIIETAKFDNKSNLLFDVSINDGNKLAEEIEVWATKDCKINFGGLIGIKVINKRRHEGMKIFSFSSDYLEINIMEFKNFIKKEPEVQEYHEYLIKSRS